MEIVNLHQSPFSNLQSRFFAYLYNQTICIWALAPGGSYVVAVGFDPVVGGIVGSENVGEVAEDSNPRFST